MADDGCQPEYLHFASSDGSHSMVAGFQERVSRKRESTEPKLYPFYDLGLEVTLASFPPYSIGWIGHEPPPRFQRGEQRPHFLVGGMPKSH